MFSMSVELWKSIFDWATVVLAALTFVALAGAVLTGNVLGERQEKEIAQLKKETGEANQKAGEANDRASANEKEAQQLRKEAEAERLARVKIEAMVAFRSLDEQQQRDLGKALNRFGNITGVSMWYANGSAEAESFADDIAAALRFAHIHTTTIGGLMQMREGGGNWDKPIEVARTGVDISSTTNSTARELADALVTELTGRGFDVARLADQPLKDDKPPAPLVWVTVQARPKGSQGEYKLKAQSKAQQ